ncbi:MAG: hypothetical protein JXA14_24965 [Anaerolineae bacterium]|nr:hypothetical protein [Anaerolineae bacterium]
MKSSAFTAGQRRVLMVMIILVIAVFAALAGFIVTSLQDQQSPPPVTGAPSMLDVPTVAPATVTPSPTPIPTTEQLADGITSRVQAARLLDQIERQVETVRGLSPRAEVPLNFLNEDEMASLLRRLYRQRDPEALLLPYITLGLLPDETISIQVGQTAGAYILEEEQLYVVTNPSEINADDRVLVLAHAYGRALQDQHFDLEAAEARARTTDVELAVAALEGGDEMLLMALYRYGDLMAADWAHLEALVLAEMPSYGEELDGSQAWARLRSFPYREGRRFAATLFEMEGWNTVNRAYVDLPRSTEQVLHPERYLAEEPDTPTDVFVPDLSGVLGEGWALGVRDTLGEFVAGVYLEQTLTEQMAWQAADGWDGDTFVVWEHEDGGRVRVWRTIWDSTVEAAEFERALVTLVPQRYLPTRPVGPPRGLPGSWWETDSGVVCVYRVARYVVFADGPDANTLAEVVEALP